MLTNTLYVLQEYKDIQDNPWAQNKRDDWNKHTSKAAVIPYKYIRMIWVHCNKMESIPEANQLWICFASCENMHWKLFIRGITDCPRNGVETDAGIAGTTAGYLDLPDGRGRGWACNMVIHFGLKQFLFQIFLVASFNLFAIPDILCYFVTLPQNSNSTQLSLSTWLCPLDWIRVCHQTQKKEKHMSDPSNFHTK